MRTMLRRVIAVWLVAWAIGAPAVAGAQQATAAEPELWRAMLGRLEAGALVSVRLKDGTRTKGIVLHVGDETFTFKPRTRIPVPARDVAFTDVSTIERQKPSMSPGKKTLLGVGVGAGVYLIVTAIIVAALDYD